VFLLNNGQVYMLTLSRRGWLSTNTLQENALRDATLSRARTLMLDAPDTCMDDVDVLGDGERYMRP
jgi:hypothetical protein